MRLIDADDFKKFMQALCKAGAPYESVVELLDKQSTSYDIGKVVEELEKLADENYKAYCIAFNSDDRAEYDAYTNAIEIVKQGGIFEHKTLKCQGCRFEHIKEDDAFNCDCVHCSRAYSDCYEKVVE